MNADKRRTKDMPGILVGASAETNLSGIVKALGATGYNINFCLTREELMNAAESRHPALMLIEAGWTGADPDAFCGMLAELKEKPAVPMFAFLRETDGTTSAECLKAGAVDALKAPFDHEEAILRVQNQMNNHILRVELEEAGNKNNDEKELLHTTLHSIGEGVICTDRNGIVTLMNPVAQDLTGWPGDEGLGQPFLTVFNVVNEQTRSLQFDPVEKVLRTGEIVELANHSILVSRDGTERPIIDNAAPIIDSSGQVSGVVLVFRDVTEERGYVEEIEYLSFHDPLTGLYNRRFYMEELKRLDTQRRLPLTLVMGDVNGLKLTNDSFGHETGDRLICKTGEILKQVMRHDDILCRYGGDEFVAILPNTEIQMAESIVRRVQNRIGESQPDGGVLSVSFGFDCKLEIEQDIEEVFKNAEDNMYKTKLVESPSVRSATIHAVINTLFEKNPREEAHSKRVSELATRLASAMKLPAAVVDKVRTAALMHDIGKIIVPDGVLDSPDHLSDGEWLDIRKHPETGYRILNCAPEMREISDIILQHHEHWDGTGYPKGIAGRDIDLCARIIAIADTYDAMTSARPYRQAMDAEIALKEITENAGKQFDADLAREFVKMCSWDLCLEKVQRRG